MQQDMPLCTSFQYTEPDAVSETKRSLSMGTLYLHRDAKEADVNAVEASSARGDGLEPAVYNSIARAESYRGRE
jgi:hypothetical protein